MSVRALTIAAAFLIAVPSSAFAQQAICESVRGDINLDGQTNIFDVQCHILIAVNHLAGITHVSPICGASEDSEVDQNCDQSINIVDVYMTVQAALEQPWSSHTDGDGDGCADRCETIEFECEDGWMNPHCDLMIGDCSQSSCPGETECTELDGGHICS